MKNVSRIQPNKCYGCQACINVCPKGCIREEKDENGFVIPKVNSSKCIDCGLCLQTCPSYMQKKGKRIDKMEIYAAFNRNDENRLKSTSGGIFYPLAKHVIEKGGCVFGASLGDNFKIVHVCAENLDDVQRCMKSKYVQSDMNNVYREVASRSQRQLVLFTGTPCQVAAIYKYPNVNKDNLITVDLICHGIPSPKLWEKNLDEKIKEYGDIKQIKTRDKESYGSLQSETVIVFQNGYEYRKVLDKDFYMKAFMQGYSLRSTCYDCHYKGMNRMSDITLGDFTSADKYIKDLNSDAGVSMLIVNSPKGKRCVDGMKGGLALHRIFNKSVLIEDWTWGMSYPYSRKRTYFYENCFGQNVPIKRSLKKADLLAKKNMDSMDYEKAKELKLKIKEVYRRFYLKYIFKL